MNPKTFQEHYDILKNEIQRHTPNADFTEGSLLDVLCGSWALGAVEQQATFLGRFNKTLFSFSALEGADLEALAVDHFYDGAARPQAQGAIGAITITRKSGNTDRISVMQGDQFQSGGQTFEAQELVTILGAANSGVVLLRAVEPGPSGNIPANSEWTSDISEVTIANSEAFQGGYEEMNDTDYRDFIRNFIVSLENGTRRGIEAQARNVSGVEHASVVKILLNVGELNQAGSALKAGGAKFKDIQTKLYVAGSGGVANTALLEEVRFRIEAQVSAEDSIEVLSASPRVIDMTLNLVYDATVSEAVALSKTPDRVKNAFEQGINGLAIGADLDVSSFPGSVISANGWAGYFSTAEVTIPNADVSIDENEKAVAGVVTIQSS